ncbi:hypothetical protein [Nocardioides ferulae]|uniref:hypothetical protein n=1 Tax=Nocardioides ferulae TaxID=2340821 RepID=UPI000EAF0B65|nr:hypothetical protein [Nocardioides ferulae]
MTGGGRPEPRGPILFLLALVLTGLLVVAWGAAHPDAVLGGQPRAGEPEPRTPVGMGWTPGRPDAAADPEDGSEETEESAAEGPDQPGDSPQSEADTDAGSGEQAVLPHGGRRIFAGNRFLVAYYGTAQTGALGVLGETEPEQMQHRVRRAARPFRRPGQPVQIVYELIVTIADRTPGRDGDYSHDIPRAEVRRYVRAARRHGALLLLDLQPGRSDFATVARRWAWALREPHVGLALDPEWRMGPRSVPASVIGHVRPAEVNRTSAWLSRLVRRHDLPEKLFVLHQFRTSMLPRIERIRDRPGLAMVQHADGFGTRRQKLDTYRVIARPGRFTMGLKLFYDEDRNRMGPAAVHAIRPRVRFVSYQ